FDSIPGKVEFQKVAYSVGLYKWDPTVAKFVQAAQPSPWLWDETYDRDWPTFSVSGNFWRSFTTSLPTQPSFTIPAADVGYYRLKVAYYWYAHRQSYKGQVTDVPSFSIFEWVKHQYPGDEGLTNVATANYPADSYCVFGVDPAAGP